MGVKNNVSLDNVAALREAARHELGYRAFVDMGNDLYKFKPASVLADDGVDVIRPNNILGPDAANPGRWIKVKFAADDLAGVVSGTGAADQVAVWSGVSTQDGSANLTFDGATLAVIGGITVSGTSTLTGVTTHGGDVVSDTDSTDSLGNTSFRWAGLFVDDITTTTQITVGPFEAGVVTATIGAYGTGITFIVVRETTTDTEVALGVSSIGFVGTTSSDDFHISTNNLSRWIYGATTGHMTTKIDNVQDIGATATTFRPRTGFFGTSINVVNGIVLLDTNGITLGSDVNLSRGGAGLLLLADGDSFTIQGGSLTVNEGATATGDLRVEGESLQRLLATDASAATENVILCADLAPNFQTMDRGYFLGDVTTAPTANPTAGIFVWSGAGEGTARSGGGTVTIWAPDGLHCETCGSDFWTVASLNMNWESWCFICGVCSATYKGGPQNVLDQLTPHQNTELIRQTSTWEEVKQMMKLVT